MGTICNQSLTGLQLYVAVSQRSPNFNSEMAHQNYYSGNGSLGIDAVKAWLRADHPTRDWAQLFSLFEVPSSLCRTAF